VPFYEGLLEPLGWSRGGECTGERGVRNVLLRPPAEGGCWLDLREKLSDAHPAPYDRYALGVHHIAFKAPSREVVDERAAWLEGIGAPTEGAPREYDYSPGYYAVFALDPDGLKLEVMNQPSS
jgi:catechol 2,3-dioxygenase-like lactoylglutathione lyase family enzyme